MRQKKAAEVTYSVIVFILRFIVVAVGVLNLLRVILAGVPQLSLELLLLQGASFLLLLSIIFLKIRFCDCIS